MGKTELFLTIILFNIFFVFFIVAVTVYIRKYKNRKVEYLGEIKIKNEIHQRELLATQLEIQQTTMQQIGREIHDNVGQKLTLVSLYTQQLLYENKAPEASERIDQISHIINQSLQDLRNLSKTLTDDNISQKEIVALIEEEVDITNAIKKCSVSFEHNFKDLDLDFMHKNVLLRITQEFIQNSIKHSQCKNIFIKLNTSENNLWELTLNDDGVGFDTSANLSKGIGLTNMKNRAKIIGAEFSLESKKDSGTTLSIFYKKQA
ncbi:Sensor protein VraS [Chryseobacterium aquaeductus]|uniref:histidine kinase n=1 Tax=Chryseobacterium aquaeductus TaxID=2675056 RepID=A0A9N8MFK9_9FLAO|nr:histidine kinase [Chryseobacterium aquaeductus]CAA7330303.1 Sensor protein VraS [Chryseobacterium potabilaquae]CAD7802693.1 Sensor protein VraS [Chryseobacterium aquaeductus]